MPPANDDDAPLQRTPIGEADLRAHVEGALDDEARSIVEGHLACNPDLAARVMTAPHPKRHGRTAAAAPTPSVCPGRRCIRRLPRLSAAAA